MEIRSNNVWLWMVVVFCCLMACAQGNHEDLGRIAYEENSTVDQRLQYTNPIFEPVLADPSFVRADNYFYTYNTEDHWDNEGGYHLLPVIHSQDLVHWEFVRDAMSAKPDWKYRGGIWAPDVSEVENQYYKYYSGSTWGDPNPGIGLAVAQHPEGPFVDLGKVFSSHEIRVDNSIDPFYWEKDGQKYLFWGSFHGIYIVPLTDDGNQTEPIGDHSC